MALHLWLEHIPARAIASFTDPGTAPEAVTWPSWLRLWIRHPLAKQLPCSHPPFIISLGPGRNIILKKDALSCNRFLRVQLHILITAFQRPSWTFLRSENSCVYLCYFACSQWYMVLKTEKKEKKTNPKLNSPSQFSRILHKK